MAGSRLPLFQSLLLGCANFTVRLGILRTSPTRWVFDYAYNKYKQSLEGHAAAALSSLIIPGSWVVDIGANAGFYALHFAKHLGDEGKVLAVEPEAINLLRLNAAIARADQTDRVIPIAAAMTDTDGPATLGVDPENPADHRLSASNAPETGSAVVGRTLDSVLVDFGEPPISLIKIDVQGAESMVLAGAQNTLRRCKPALYIEIDHMALDRFGDSASALVALIQNLGYQPYQLEKAGTPPSLISPPILTAALNDNAYIDILFMLEPASNDLAIPRS